MNAKEIVTNLISNAPGWSQNKMAKALNLSSQAMSNRMNTNDLKAGFVAEILDQLGYQLVVVPPQSTLPAGSFVIDNSKQKPKEEQQ